MNIRMSLTGIIMLFAIMIVTLTACSEPPGRQEQEALKLLTAYKKAQMEVTDYRQVPEFEEILNATESFLTETEFEKQAINRSLTLYKEMAKLHERNIELGEISLEKMDSEVFDYAYELTLRITNDQGELLGEHQVPGQIKLVEQDGNWLIGKEWSRMLGLSKFE